MLFRPAPEDLKLIAFQLGRILYVVAIAGLIPLILAALNEDWHSVSTFMFMIGITGILSLSSEPWRPREFKLDWHHGIVVVALAWLIVPALGAIPLGLSRHYGSFLDAYFDAMSGVTTTGLAVVQDLDHLAPAVNVWRSALQFLGGQGIVLAALTFLAGSGVLALYQGEARDERVLPSVTSTARFIWTVSLVHAAFGVTALWAICYLVLGFDPIRSVLHALTIFMAAFDTGGFAPMSTSLGYYHSFTFEAVTSVLMVAGALSFGVHYALWRGRRAILKNLETRTILATFGVTMVVTMFGLAATGLYTNWLGLGRQGFFQILSAHTGTGFATVPSVDLGLWTGLAFAGMVVAMGLGGMGSSTAGGVKAIRVGLTTKGFVNTIRAALLPEGSVISNRFWQNGPRTMHGDMARSVMTITILYVGLYVVGAIAGIAFGYPLEHALFESVSAGANVGLSVGITDAAMPTLLKWIYIAQMWAGRLEFIAVFALGGFILSLVRGRS